MMYYVDIDNTICITTGINYSNAIPIQENIDKINKLYDEGCTIVYYTARGQSTGINHTALTEHQLQKWGCKYHQLKLNKPAFDYIIDDKAMRIEEL